MELKDRLFVSTSCITGKKSYEETFKYILKANIQNIEISGNHIYLDNSKLINLINSYKKKRTNFIFHNYFPIPKKEFVMNPLSKDKIISKHTFDIIDNALLISKKTKTKLYTFHPGYLRDAKITNNKFNFYGNKINKDEIIRLYNEKFSNFFQNSKFFNSNDAIIGFENLFPNSDGSNDSFMCNFEELKNIFELPFIKKSKIGILIDLGHLQISSNLLNFDKFTFIDKVVDLYGDKIYEVHISENDGVSDLHQRITNQSWQLEILDMFKKTGLKDRPTVFTIESRNLSVEQLKTDYDIILNKILKI
tara:strand:+ start:7633 stop:8550 length:918 start_codon:yes stop_codon:yes gene_type:complete